jgi:hypothetical protein
MTMRPLSVSAVTGSAMVATKLFIGVSILPAWWHSHPLWEGIHIRIAYLLGLSFLELGTCLVAAELGYLFAKGLRKSTGRLPSRREDRTDAS